MATTNIELDIENITGVADADDQLIKTAQKFVVSSIPKDLMLWAGTTTAVGSHGGDSSPTAITLPQPTDNIIDVQVFLTNMKDDFNIYNEIYAEYFKNNQPYRTTIEIKSLPTPIAIELKVIATI